MTYRPGHLAERKFVFTADELLALIDPLAVDRLRPSWSFNADRFSQINWLVVRETVALEANVGKRALPWLFETLNRDFFKIEPHKERYPAPVERALFSSARAMGRLDRTP